MKLSDLMRICFTDLNNKKSRTFLTALGVLVGTCAIIVMISIGIAMEKSQNEMLSEMGNLKQIKVYNYNANKQNAITDKKLQTWAKMNGIDVVTPLYYFNNSGITVEGKGQRGKKYSMNADIIGVYPEALKKMGLKTVEGDLNLSDSDLKKESPREVNVVIGEETEYQFRDPKKGFRSHSFSFGLGADAVIGGNNGNHTADPFVNMFLDKVMMKLKRGQTEKTIDFAVRTKAKIKADYNIHYATGQGMFVDINRFKELMKKAGSYKKEDEQKGYTEVLIMLTDLKYADEVEKNLKGEGYDISSLTEMRKQLQESRNKQLQMLYSMGILALFVATISIMNTMVMSISERTKEIGVMKVLGCRISDIRRLFLVEAGAIGLMGGLAGVILSYIISFFMNHFGSGLVNQAIDGMEYMGQGAVSIIPFPLAAFGLAVSVVVGVLAGFLPANRAVKISAREAMVNG